MIRAELLGLYDRQGPTAVFCDFGAHGAHARSLVVPERSKT